MNEMRVDSGVVKQSFALSFSLAYSVLFICYSLGEGLARMKRCSNCHWFDGGHCFNNPSRQPRPVNENAKNLSCWEEKKK